MVAVVGDDTLSIMSLVAAALTPAMMSIALGVVECGDDAPAAAARASMLRSPIPPLLPTVRICMRLIGDREPVVAIPPIGECVLMLAPRALSCTPMRSLARPPVGEQESLLPTDGAVGVHGDLASDMLDSSWWYVATPRRPPPLFVLPVELSASLFSMLSVSFDGWICPTLGGS